MHDVRAADITHHRKQCARAAHGIAERKPVGEMKLANHRKTLHVGLFVEQWNEYSGPDYMRCLQDTCRKNARAETDGNTCMHEK
ncbi:hypothetical protein PPGU19_065300 (plasmid) [Paraburkholderia sp. PGU19]|nr:hypothetical protein PPGU19_065300 [Paraburkholderia sp. PGU19]